MPLSTMVCATDLLLIWAGHAPRHRMTGLCSHLLLAAVVQLRVEGEGLRTVELSLQDLKTKFKKHSLSATLQCSGNRRHELSVVKPIKGLDWSIGGCTQQLS